MTSSKYNCQKKVKKSLKKKKMIKPMKELPTTLVLPSDDFSYDANLFLMAAKAKKKF